MNSPTNTAILLVNLGTPSSLELSDIKKYLNEFLMDKYVIDYPWPLRALLVKGIILNFRPKKTQHAYRQIWTPRGSPLLSHSEDYQSSLQKQLPVPVFLAMRYGEPSISQFFANEAKKYRRIVVWPMYPQYAESSSETAIQKVKEMAATHQVAATLEYVPPFYDQNFYIQSLVNSAQSHLTGVDHLVLSYHSLPNSHIRKTESVKNSCLSKVASENLNGALECCDRFLNRNCYRAQSQRTTRLLLQALNWPVAKASLTFQSRLGPEKWLTPNTEDRLLELAKSGVKKIAIMAPSFTCDCLETIEELGQRGKDLFLNNGGTEYRLIPCLNAQSFWCQASANWLKDNIL